MASVGTYGAWFLQARSQHTRVHRSRDDEWIFQRCLYPRSVFIACVSSCGARHRLGLRVISTAFTPGSIERCVRLLVSGHNARDRHTVCRGVRRWRDTDRAPSTHIICRSRDRVKTTHSVMSPPRRNTHIVTDLSPVLFTTKRRHHRPPRGKSRVRPEVTRESGVLRQGVLRGHGWRFPGLLRRACQDAGEAPGAVPAHGGVRGRGRETRPLRRGCQGCGERPESHGDRRGRVLRVGDGAAP